MAHKKAGSAVKTNKDSISKRLGIKKYGGEAVQIGQIIVRQKGTKFHPGVGTKLGNDFTLFAIQSGKVQYKQKLGRKVVNVVQN